MNPTGGVTPPQEAGLSRDAYSLLAQANLLRMRGLWSEAVEKCMEALKLAPENASAQSLLGDIYENQGLLDDAIQWYRMALDVQPDSPADKLKLSRALEAKSRALSPLPTRKPAGEPERVTAAPQPGPPMRPVPPSSPNPDLWLRRTAYGAGALALLVILLALGVSKSGAGGGPQVSVAPVVVPSVTPAPATPPNPAPPTFPNPAADPAEQDLATAIRGVSGLSAQGVGVADVSVDPRAGRLVLTVTCQPPPNTPLPGRDLVLRDALRALQAAVQVTDAQSYTAFTIRCLAAPSSSGGSTPLLFMADATRSGVSATPADLAPLSSGQVLSAFTNPWWSPSVPQ